MRTISGFSLNQQRNGAFYPRMWIKEHSHAKLLEELPADLNSFYQKKLLLLRSWLAIEQIIVDSHLLIVAKVSHHLHIIAITRLAHGFLN